MTKYTPELVKNIQAYCRGERQTEILKAVIEEGTIRKAAKALGIDKGNVWRACDKVYRTACWQGYSENGGPAEDIPETHYLKGTSTYYDGDGNVRGRWVKTNAKIQDIMEELREFSEGLGETVVGEFKKVKAPKQVEKGLLTVYPLADFHLGMLAWSAETREDYDTAIASDALNVAASLLTDKTPKSETAIIANLGDFFHFDDDTKQTAASGHSLDVDSRWAAVIRLGVENMLRFIRFALEKHKRVKVVNSIGNHDGQSALMLPFILKPYFMNEPRVEIEEAPRLHHYHIFGSSLLGFHHGHKTPASRLVDCMTADQLMNPHVDTSKIEFGHWITGHIHHDSKKDYGQITFEAFRTLAAKDAYHAGAGYRALRDMQAVTYDVDYGECDRARVSFKMIERHSKQRATRESRSHRP